MLSWMYPSQNPYGVGNMPRFPHVVFTSVVNTKKSLGHDRHSESNYNLTMKTQIMSLF